MRIPIHKGWLVPLSVSHAHELFDLIHASRSHLHQWLPWLRRIHSYEDTLAFVEHLLAESGPQYVIKIEERICGGAGFQHLKKGTGEVGYWLGSEFVGQGIMADAVKHLCGHGFTELDLERICIRCAAQNRGSCKVPERLGFYHEGIDPKAEWIYDRYVDHAVYSILRAEFNVLYPEFTIDDASKAHSQGR